MCIHISINGHLSTLSLLLCAFSLSPIRMFFVLHQMPTLLLKTVFCLHLLYSHMSMMQLTISATIVRARIKQTLFHFSLFLSALYYINFGLSSVIVIEYLFNFNQYSFFSQMPFYTEQRHQPHHNS